MFELELLVGLFHPPSTPSTPSREAAANKTQRAVIYVGWFEMYRVVQVARLSGPNP